MMQLEIADALRSATINVLETMFFTDAVPVEKEDVAPQSDALACELQCSGGENGSFGVAVDRIALQALCCAFYGEEGGATPTQEQDLICELTNMLAGSTLSRYAPAHACTLSSPLLCDYSPWATTLGQQDIVSQKDRLTRLNLSLDGGLLLLWCSLRRVA